MTNQIEPVRKSSLDYSKEPIHIVPVPPVKPALEEENKPENHLALILLIVTVALILASLFVIYIGFKNGAVNLQNQYVDSAKTAKDKMYQIFYNSGKENYHVEHIVTVTFEGIRKVNKLEVYHVSDVEYLPVLDENNDQNTAVLETPGKGVFTVDLSLAEINVDKDRRHILIRVPTPELSNYSLDYDNIKIFKLTGKEGFWESFSDGSYAEGTEKAEKALQEAQLMVKESFTTNPLFYENLNSSAKTMISSLIKSLNPEIPDLKVDVEFF